MARRQFTLEWFKEFGWINNPFRLEIFNPIERYIAGLEKERQKLNYFIIENFPYGTIKGDKGSGKTMLMLWLKQSLQDYKGSIVADYYKAEERGVSLKEQVIDNLTGIHDKIVMGSLFKLKLKKLFSRKKKVPNPHQNEEEEKKGMYEILYNRQFTAFEDLIPFFEKKLKNQRLVLLIDDADLLSEQDIKFVNDLIACRLPTQVIACCDADKKIKIEEKDVLKMKLSEMSYNDMKKFVQNRIQSVGGGNRIYPFSEHQLHSIYNKSKKNPLKMLKLLYDQAVKLSLKHRANIKKGIKPKEEKIEEFDEVAEYNKLLAEERKKKGLDANDLILKTKIPKEEKKKDSFIEKDLPAKKTQTEPAPVNDYAIQVVHRENTAPIEIMSDDGSGYMIKEVSKKKAPLKRISPAKKSKKKRTRTRSHKKSAKKSSKKAGKKTRRKTSKKKRKHRSRR